MVRFLSFLAAVLSVAGAGTAQPLSQSLAGCAGLLEAVQIVVPEHENIARIEAAVAAFPRAAREEADAEVRDDPEAWVAQSLADTRAQWARHGGLAVFSEDSVDAVDACRPVAEGRGIDMDFD